MKKILLSSIILGLSIGTANAKETPKVEAPKKEVEAPKKEVEAEKVYNLLTNKITNTGNLNKGITFNALGSNGEVFSQQIKYDVSPAELAVGGTKNVLDNQNANTVGALLGTTFNVPKLDLVDQADAGEHNNTFTSETSFSYLAVHFGQAEAFFHFANPIKSFTVNVIEGKELSNFRAYNAAVTAVPEAEEWAMMMLGLGVVGLVARRKKAA